jgi:periplasmic protein TonB
MKSVFPTSRALRDSSGVLITAAVHLVLGYVALTATGIVKVPNIIQPQAPLWIEDIKPATPETPPPPAMKDTVDITVVEPVIVVDTPQQAPIVRDEQALILPRVPDVTGPVGPAQVAEPVLVAPSLDPRYRDRFQPAYPPASRRAGEGGSVVVSVLVGADGRVADAEVARSSGYGRLDNAAIRQALSAWRFRPATRDGVAVQSRHQITVTFVLNP